MSSVLRRSKDCIDLYRLALGDGLDYLVSNLYKIVAPSDTFCSVYYDAYSKFVAFG
jgi:hypothetical protein